MRRATIVGAVSVVLALPAAAAAKGGGLRFCGADACRTVLDLTLRTRIGTALAATRGTTLAPAHPAPFYRIILVDDRGRAWSGYPDAYYVPSVQVVRVERTDEALWLPTDGAKAAFDEATRGIDPFPKPSVTLARVGLRPGHDPASYLRLYEFVAGGERVADPLGPRPALDWRNYDALVRYYRRDRRIWIPIRLQSSKPTPWTDDTAQLSVGRRDDLLRGDGVVVRMPHALAERVRSGSALGTKRARRV